MHVENKVNVAVVAFLLLLHSAVVAVVALLLLLHSAVALW